MTGGDRISMLESLAGLSVGDAFGQRFFLPEVVSSCLSHRNAPPGPWRWTDDTNMALSIVEVLLASGRLDQDALAKSFASKYEGSRGYGPAMHRLLPRLAAGGDWRTEAGALFGGRGSYQVVRKIGNGSRITAQDTVAFAVWTAACHLNDYEEALWRTVAAGGDVDTTCAIVGGIVASRVGIEGIPPAWLERTEPLPDWASPGSETPV